MLSLKYNRQHCLYTFGNVSQHSPEDGQLNLADPGYNHFFAFLEALYHTQSESGVCNMFKGP